MKWTMESCESLRARHVVDCRHVCLCFSVYRSTVLTMVRIFVGCGHGCLLSLLPDCTLVTRL